MVNKVINTLLALAITLVGLTGCAVVGLDNTDTQQKTPTTTTQQPTQPSTTTMQQPTQMPTTTTQQPTQPLTTTIQQPTQTQEPEGVIINLAMSNKARITNPSVDTEDMLALTSGNLAFTADLYAALKAGDGNIFLSPYSTSQALAMTYAGARGETEAQMASTLHFTLPQGALHPAFNSLDIQLAQRGEGAEGKDGEGFRLNIVNAAWGQQGFTFLPGYLEILAENYGAGINLLDFARAPEPSRITINDWISEQTEGRIEDLLAEGSITEATRLVLTNAIYFNAAWQYPFDEKFTQSDNFYLLDGSSVEVPMMKQVNYFGYLEGSNYQAVELPYSGGELSMVILLPKEGEFTNFEASLDGQTLSGILNGIEYMDVALSIPRFEFDSQFSLKQTLAEMGMPIAFSDSADFSGMNGNLELYIGDVMHKAFVSVDEAGTEAEAATAVIMELKGIPEEPMEVTVDRPFIFLIRDIKTDSVLFIGKVINPKA